jgi:hypothetical protein
LRWFRKKKGKDQRKTATSKVVGFFTTPTTDIKIVDLFFEQTIKKGSELGGSSDMYRYIPESI